MYHLNTLLYADDIVLLSDSKEGLQNCLNALSNYCSSWKLQVNTEKSKVIVFNSIGKSFINELYYNDETLETVSNYCYLGINIRYNGSFNVFITSL